MRSTQRTRRKNSKPKGRTRRRRVRTRKPGYRGGAKSSRKRRLANHGSTPYDPGQRISKVVRKPAPAIESRGRTAFRIAFSGRETLEWPYINPLSVRLDYYGFVGSGIEVQAANLLNPEGYYYFIRANLRQPRGEEIKPVGDAGEQVTAAEVMRCASSTEITYEGSSSSDGRGIQQQETTRLAQSTNEPGFLPCFQLYCGAGKRETGDSLRFPSNPFETLKSYAQNSNMNLNSITIIAVPDHYTKPRQLVTTREGSGETIGLGEPLLDALKGRRGIVQSTGEVSNACMGEDERRNIQTVESIIVGRPYGTVAIVLKLPGAGFTRVGELDRAIIATKKRMEVEIPLALPASLNDDGTDTDGKQGGLARACIYATVAHLAKFANKREWLETKYKKLMNQAMSLPDSKRNQRIELIKTQYYEKKHEYDCKL